MAAAGLPPSVKREILLRGACAAMAAAAALLLGLSEQTKTVLFVRKKAVSKEVQALWVLIVASAAASVYHVIQLAKTLYLGHFPRNGGGCRRLSRGMACVSLLLDKVCTKHAFALYSDDSIPPDTETEQPDLPPNRFHI
ncbi:hypothetical protein EJB05_24575 [Eragrostis curvula]|uniref:CASP-like protein n=1 Tax=Eragrostis curvula TaxID=38414 RepID=A0A5J9VBM5_9POAL|nr:hypothetical protein EJB05_24575 [Eragrostis curvula]